MPDDKEEQEVTEQEEPTEEEQESSGFDFDFGDDKEEKKEEKEEEETDKEEADKETEDKEEKEEKEEAEDKTEEKVTEDERGKKLLEAETEAKEKADAEAKAKAEADAKAKAEAESKKIIPITDEDIKNFSSFFTDGELPGEVMVGDIPVNVKEMINDFPALVPITVAVVQKALRGMVSSGTLLTKGSLDRATGNLDQGLADARFEIEVYKIATPKGIDMDAVLGSDDFSKWFNDQPETTKVLMRGSPRDVVDCVVKYQDAQKVADAKEKTDKADEEKKDEKKEHDDLHESTIDSKEKAESPSSKSEDAEMKEGWDEGGKEKKD